MSLWSPGWSRSRKDLRPSTNQHNKFSYPFFVNTIGILIDWMHLWKVYEDLCTLFHPTDNCCFYHFLQCVKTRPLCANWIMYKVNTHFSTFSALNMINLMQTDCSSFSMHITRIHQNDDLGQFKCVTTQLDLYFHLSVLQSITGSSNTETIVTSPI